jgi:hypothetical protein
MLAKEDAVVVGHGAARLIKEEDVFCEPCVLGKHARDPFPASGSRATKPGELIHFDIAGKFSEPSFKDARFMSIFVDDYSGKLFVNHHVKKSELPAAMEEMLNVARAAGHTVLKVRSDNAKENIGAEMKKVLLARQIVAETSTAYSPQQNSRAERGIRTIEEGARCLMTQIEDGGDVAKGLWAELTATAAYLRNRCTNAHSGGKTAEELWSGRPPKIDHLRVIGSDAYAQIPAVKRESTFAAKSQKLVLVGYSPGKKAYRLWERGTKLVHISRDVKFNERVNGNGRPFVVPVGATPITDVQPEPQQTAAEESAPTRAEADKQSRKATRNVSTREPYELRSAAGRNSDDTLLCMAIGDEPKTLAEAFARPDGPKWRAAAATEWRALEEQQCFQLVARPIADNILRCMWVARIKSDGRYKMRLVVKGCGQVPGVDFHESSAPVVRFETTRVMLSIAAADDLELMQFDVDHAFLNGDLDEDVFMEQPEGYKDETTRVIKLRRSLYGLKQAPLMWFRKLDPVLRELGFAPSQFDRCLYVNLSAGIYLAIYVDDGLVAGPSLEAINDVISRLGEKFKVTSSAANCYVGIEVERNRARREIRLHQTAYCKKVIERFGLLDAKPASVPADPNTDLSIVDVESTPLTDIPYRELVGSLMFLMVGTRPDLAYIVGKLSANLDSPHAVHWNAGKRVVRYLKATPTRGITFGRPTREQNELVAYSDADWAGDTKDSKSTSGVLMMMNGGPLVWSSRKQTCVSVSTTESEYVAMCAAAKEIVWLRGLLGDCDKKQAEPTPLFCDNMGAVALIKNPVFHRRSKHINVQYNYTRSLEDDLTLEVSHVGTEEQLADFLTKPLATRKLEQNLHAISMV